MDSASLTACRLPPLLWRLTIYSLLWLVLTNGSLTSWPFGLPAVALASWLSLQLKSPASESIRFFALLTFLPFFLLRSLWAAIDVMGRVLNPRLPLHPGLVSYNLRLPAGRARLLLANCITLMPGTLSARLDKEQLLIHCLDTSLPVHVTIAELEERISHLFALSLSVHRQGQA